MRAALRRLLRSEPAFLILLGAALGVATGYGALLCHAGIGLIRRLAFGRAGDITLLAADAPPLLVLVLPALGGLVVAPMVFRWAREAKGHGVPEVMDAVARGGGRIRPRVAIVKALSSVVTIGTGGAVGWEGPIIQIGAAVGSGAGQALRVARRHLRVLVACGAAAGIAATFKAPMAGVLFALEVFLGDLALVTFTPVVVAAVAGTAVVVAHTGPAPVFDLSELVFRLQSVWEIPIYVVLGLVCACGAVFFTRSLYRIEDAVEKIRLPVLVKPALGGLAVGAIGIVVPEVLGVGYATISFAYDGAFGLPMLAALFFVKLAACSLTLSSGGSGGIFAPSLVLGAVLGAGFGEVAHRILPGVAVLPGVYAVVGMAAFVAGTTHAPMSALLILFEMTQDYAIILPLMVACVISSTTARGLFRESIYTLKLARRGVRLRGGRDATVLQALQVREAMRDDATILQASDPFSRVREHVLDSRHHVFPVVAADGRLAGVVTLDALRPFLRGDALVDVAVAGDLAEAAAYFVEPDDDLELARQRFAEAPHDELPVVDGEGVVCGVLRERDLYACYHRALDRIA